MQRRTSSQAINRKTVNAINFCNLPVPWSFFLSVLGLNRNSVRLWLLPSTETRRRRCSRWSRIPNSGSAVFCLTVKTCDIIISQWHCWKTAPRQFKAFQCQHARYHRKIYIIVCCFQGWVPQFMLEQALPGGLLEGLKVIRARASFLQQQEDTASAAAAAAAAAASER